MTDRRVPRVWLSGLPSMLNALGSISSTVKEMYSSRERKDPRTKRSLFYFNFSYFFQTGYHYVGPGNWTWVLCKSTKVFSTLEPFLQFLLYLFQVWVLIKIFTTLWRLRQEDAISSKPAWAISVGPYFKNLPTKTRAITKAVFVTVPAKVTLLYMRNNGLLFPPEKNKRFPFILQRLAYF
jgi:hypothetical protein